MTTAVLPGVDAPALVLLIGAAGSGKSTLARAHYRPEQIVSLDALRAVVADDENDQDATADAVAVLHSIVTARLSRRLTTVVDATNGVAAERAVLLAIAARYRVPAAAVVVDTDLATCLARQHDRPGPLPGRRWGRAVPESVVRNQHARTLMSLSALPGEGVTTVVHVQSGHALTVGGAAG
jgi:predicted kinase